MILINWGRRDNKKMRVHRVVDRVPICPQSSFMSECHRDKLLIDRTGTKLENVLNAALQIHITAI